MSSTVTKMSEFPSNINPSGLIPVEFKCLVQPIEIEEVTEGGIILLDETVEQAEVAQCRARLIDVGGRAFFDWGSGRNPKPGDMVLMAKYAGINVEGSDGKDYRVIQDKDITAILVE